MAAAAAVSVTVRGLIKRFGEGAAAVNGIDLEIKPGDFFTLLGPSGCGKTTTLRMIAGLEHPDAGVIQVGDQVVSAPAHKVFVQPDKRHIGMVFQSYAVWPHMTVFENVAFPLHMRRRSKTEVYDLTMASLDQVGLKAFADRPAPRLSGGQQQRVALARALVGSPRVLLLDEPLSNLDARLREDMRFEIRSMQQRLGITTIFVTHDQDEAMTLSDEIAVMRLGNVEQLGTPTEVYQNPASKYVMDFLGKANHLDARIKRADGGLSAIVASQDIPLVVADGMSDGDEVVLTFRSECVELCETDAQLRGAVTAATYVGDRIDYLVDVGDGTIHASGPTTKPIRVGAATGVRLEPSGVRAWPRYQEVGPQ